MQAEIADFQAPEYLVDNSGHFRVKVQRHNIIVDNIDIALVKLSESSLLRPLAAPDTLHLVALERDYEVVVVFCDVTGQGHGQVVLPPQASVATLMICLQRFEAVSCFIRLAFG